MRLLETAEFFIFAISLTLVSQEASSTQASVEPKTSIGWFQRANDQMNLRVPGAARFHMKVSFHAFPGKQPNEHPDILTGDGIYEETWLEPHKWRREVTFSGFHAVETESETGRKLQASSDYEPSRVLMLLNGILDPIPRNFQSREYRHEGATGWQVDRLSKGNVSLVRISLSSVGERGQSNDVYYFSPKGVLLIRNFVGLATTWERVSWARVDYQAELGHPALSGSGGRFGFISLCFGDGRFESSID